MYIFICYVCICLFNSCLTNVIDFFTCLSVRPSGGLDYVTDLQQSSDLYVFLISIVESHLTHEIITGLNRQMRTKLALIQ